VDWLVRVALSNTLLAAMLALAALAISRTFRRPALSHALWLIVLLKLITPPLWNIAVPLMPPEKIPTHILPPSNLSLPPTEPAPITVASGQSEQMEFAQGDGVLIENDGAASRTLQETIQAPMAAGWQLPRLSISQGLVIIWGGGSLLCALIISARVRRFARLLRFADPAPAQVQILARALGSRLGISRYPRVWFVPGPLCPMLWAFAGQARLLIPANLWDRLDDAQRSTLLLHELAHYHRGDHWIRGLELLVTILFWWNPIAWWARHELREAEEQCCDAWVVWTLPQAARDYAIALMEAIDFVSKAPLAVPVLASPMGEFHDLKRRLLMIRQHDAPRALGWTGFSMICALAAILLPLSASLAQQEKPQPTGLPGINPFGQPAGEAAAPPPAPVNPVGPAVEGDPNAAAQREARALEQELQATSIEIAQLTNRLKQAQARLRELRNAHNRNPNPNNVPGDVAVTVEGGLVTNAKPEPLPRLGASARIGLTRVPPPAVGLPPADNDQERRLRTVEDKLDMLIDEIRQIRQDRKDRPVERAPDRR
jgi:beta-lactamase regulating signal transducer with metallopeptidase domain